jgi:hypothetical protein
MQPGPARTDVEQIRSLLERINGAWLKGRPEDIPAALNECFYRDMVIRGPDLQLISTGRDSCVGSYTDFLQRCVVRECTLSDADVDVTADTAVAAYTWRMVYETNAREYTESGRDLFVFGRIDGRWQAIWRAMLPDAA